MPYGTLSDELSIVLKEQGIYWTHPTYPDDPQGESPYPLTRAVLITIVFGGALDEQFEIDPDESEDYSRIVDAIFEHITTRSYAVGEDVVVDAYENGDCLYSRCTSND